ncbi:MAG: CHASE2 domain-containing protein [Verrucomicrobia bacterium]|nr:CHASE2 domain-containing protein [Verrucomicrobiota bacterium]
MTFKTGKLIPVLLCCAVSGLMVLLQSLTSRNEDFLFVRRLEWMTFDWRVRAATNQPSACAPNLGFVFINDETIRRVQSGQFGYSHGLYWPRHVYGRIVKELATQQAEAIAFDVLFPDVRRDHPLTELPDGTAVPSDKFFTDEVRRAGNVILGSLQGTVPPPAFRRSAAGLGDISAVRDSDGILRRARAFEDYLIWHNAIIEADSVFDGFSYNTNEVVFPGPGNERTRIPIAPDGTFDLATLMELGQGEKVADGVVRTSKAFTRQRVWDLGLASAAGYLNLDLNKAVVEPGKHIILRGGPDVERIIPIDREGRFYIDWSLTSHDRRIRQESAHSLLLHQRMREIGQTNEIASIWRDKIAIIGSIASGNDLADYGATPLEKGTYLTSRFWNTANSLIIDRFIRQPDFATELYIILSLGIITGILTWNLRAVSSAIGVVVIAAALRHVVALFVFRSALLAAAGDAHGHPLCHALGADQLSRGLRAARATAHPQHLRQARFPQCRHGTAQGRKTLARRRAARGHRVLLRRARLHRDDGRKSRAGRGIRARTQTLAGGRGGLL